MNEAIAIVESAAAPAVHQITDNSLVMLKQQFEQLEVCRSLAHHYCQTEMVPKQYRGKPEDGAVAIQWGAEIGLKPMQALQNVAVVNGNPTLWGDALVALVRQSGLCEYITQDWDAAAQVYTITTKRKGEPEEATGSYSFEDAKKAGLTGRDTYQKHLKIMLKSRCRAHLLRDVYADVLKGFQVREVIEEDRDVLGLSEDQAPTIKEMGAVEVEPETYPSDRFTENFPKWRKLVESGKKSPQDILTSLSSKGILTDEQTQKINNLGDAS